MKLHWIAALPVAAAFLITPSSARAQNGSGVIASETPAVVILPSALNSQKLTSGGKVVTELTHAVHLGGVDLPRGTQLIATVSDDDMQVSGHNKLALRFTEARTKHGQTIPIKATILAVNTQPEPVENNTATIEVNMPVPPNLNNQPDQIQQEGVTAGVDLRSNATSMNSGVFVTDKDDIKLPRGSKMELALAPGNGSM